MCATKFSFLYGLQVLFVLLLLRTVLMFVHNSSGLLGLSLLLSFSDKKKTQKSSGHMLKMVCVCVCQCMSFSLSLHVIQLGEAYRTMQSAFSSCCIRLNHILVAISRLKLIPSPAASVPSGLPSSSSTTSGLASTAVETMARGC